MISLDKKKTLTLMLTFCLVMLIFGVKIVKSSPTPVEWTQNSTFVQSGYQWDPILYDWRWEVDILSGYLSTGETSEEDDPTKYSDDNHAWWLEDGVVSLAAMDKNSLHDLN